MKGITIVREIITKFNDDDGPTQAAAIAYYTLLSIFPLILGLLALIGAILSDPATQQALITDIATLFPGASDLIKGTVTEVVSGRGVAGIVATIGLIWAASGVFFFISQALDRIWHASHQRNLIQKTLVAVGLVFAVGVIFVASLLLSAGLRLIASLHVPVLGISLGSVPFLFTLLGFVVPLLITFAIFSAIYMFVPTRRPSFRDVWPGALAASMLVEVSKQVFAWYLSTFANYNAVYGSIGAVIALVTWAYVAAIILLLGAELDTVLVRHRGTASSAHEETARRAS